MKKTTIALAAFVASGGALAESSTTAYGLIDAGLTYTSKVHKTDTAPGKGGVWQFVSGSSQGSRLGLSGVEELPDGVQAVFTLENGFDVGSGMPGQGGRLFGRQAFVGLSSTRGTVTLGRQYDFIGDFFPAFAVASNTPAGLLGWSLPAYAAGGYSLDNRVWGVQVDRAIKYQSTPAGGFAFGAMYGFGSQAGAATGSSSNFVLTYANGPLSAALAYMSIHNAAACPGSVEYAGGAAYNFERARLFGMISDVRSSGGPSPRATTYEGGIAFQAAPQLSLAAGALYQNRNTVRSASQLVLSADYFLSRRTDVYLVGAFAHDHGFSAQVQAALGDVSGTSVQSAVRVGIRHKF